MQRGAPKREMRSVLCLFGAVAIALACLITGRAYASYIHRRVFEYSSFLGFLQLMEREIACFLCTPRELAERCADALLENIGFLSALRRGESLSSAFSGVRERLLLSDADSEMLLSFFEKFGQGSRETELDSLGACVSQFSARAEAESNAAPSAIRLSGTLLALFALGLLILLL